MDNVKEIKRVITCGVRWGEYANSYAGLMIDNNACVLADSNKGINTFISISDQDLIALKDGHNIIALGKRKLNSNIRKGNWNGFFDQYLEQKITYEQQEKKASYFAFSLDDTIAMIDIEEWLVLDTPIYYPVMQSTVTIRDEKVIKDCINRFNELGTSSEQYISRQISFNLEKAQHLFSQYSVMSNDDDDESKAPLVKDLLSSINVVLNYEPENEIAKQMKESITTGGYLVSKSSKDLVNVYSGKAKSLRKLNRRYTIAFITTLVVFMGLSVLYIICDFTSSINNNNLIVFIFTKGVIVSSIIASIFWLARFFNKRVHENVYLIEDYEHKSLIFGSLQNLKNVFADEMTPDVFRDIINKVIENPAINLLKIKDTKPHKIEIDLKEVVKKVASELPK